MPKLYNLARMTTATTGTGTITLGVAVSGYLSFANAGAQNSDIVFYGIKDGANSEVGWGTYTSSGTTLTRNVVKSTNSNTAISLSGSAEVYITQVGADGGDILPGFDRPMRGFDGPINLQLNASAASNILTVAVKGNNGSDPSNSNPVLIAFRDPTVANGGPIWRAVTAALSINTNATGASLGSANGVPFRLWVVAFDNGGTVVLALWQSVTGGATPTAIAGLNEAAVASSTAMSGSATAAGTFYTPNGTTVTSKSFRILGYVDYGSGLATAGTYASAPTTIQLFGPGIKKPGDTVQAAQGTVTASGTVSSASFASITGGPTASLAPTSAPNVVVVSVYGNMCGSGAGTNFGGIRPFNSTSSVAVGLGVAFQIGGTNIGAACSAKGWDRPGSTASQTYIVQGFINAGTLTFPFGGATGTGAVIEAVEIMV
jgi:hypothetical protein